MGREVKRVALDFEWPIDKLWRGYVLPDKLRGKRCPDCEQGQTHLGWWLDGFAHLIAMLAADVHDRRNGRDMHPWLAEFSRAHGHFEYLIDGTWTHTFEVDHGQSVRRLPSRHVVDRPGDEALEFFHGIIAKDFELKRTKGDPTGEYPYDEWYAEDKVPSVESVAAGMGHSSSGNGVGNLRHAIFAVLEDASGKSFVCPTCSGEGVLEEYEGQNAERDAWYEAPNEEPPSGEGWQLWTTTNEGAPLTPVFESAEALARHCADKGVSWFGYQTATYDQWLRSFVGDEIVGMTVVAPGVVIL